MNRSTLIALGVLTLVLAPATWFVWQQVGGDDPWTGEPEKSTLHPIVDDWGRWGYIDRRGQVVIEPAYGHADVFHGLGLVVDRGRFGYVDAAGAWAIEPDDAVRWDAPSPPARPFWGGLAARRDTTGTWGFIDTSGGWVIEPRFAAWPQLPDQRPVGDMIEDRAWFRDSETGKVGFIDAAGEVVIEPRFDDAYDFGEGRAAVLLRGDWGFVDRRGRMKIYPRFAMAGAFSEGLAPVQDEATGRWGYIDHDGAWAIQPRFGRAYMFLEGLAPVLGDTGRWGYIGPGGETVLPMVYDEAGWFEHGLARVRVDGQLRYIGPSGTVIWPRELEATELAAAAGE
jgi:hypothetical protein